MLFRSILLHYFCSELGSTVEEDATSILELTLREVFELSNNEHNSILQLFGGYCELHGDGDIRKIYIVMELSKEGSLHHLLHTNKDIGYSPYQAFNWLIQCASAMEYLVRNQSIQRDLKT